MKKFILAISLIGGICLPVKGGDSLSRIILHTNRPAEQVINGFGAAQAGWSDALFLFPNREKVIDALYGPDGLKLNILRGEIFPHYSKEAHQYDFGLQADTSTATVAHATSLEKNELLRRGQLWLTMYTQQKYPETLLMFSAWSPPAWMKEGGELTPDQYATIRTLPIIWLHSTRLSNP